jgi:hypothetical protein
MKKLRSYSRNPHARNVAYTVSAAALMLGVSQAATVGLSFRVNYCQNHNYDGPIVSMTAFGIAPNSWQNLTPMDTGYACSSGIGPYTLMQTINKTTSTGGLNPLPNGSITVTWSADTANFSRFAGYGGGYPGYSSYAGPPHYSYSGPPPPFWNPSQPYPTGEWQVYDSFLRDGTNFAPLPGDSYSVDITGLKSLFTNSPFAVQLVAASDSMQYLTNAFVIDATLNSTQSVVYPSTPPVIDRDDQPWIRGSGGGLSTASGSLNTDHLKIIGNRASHGGDKTAGTGYNFASTLTAAIITDKPVLTMTPLQVLVCRGDTVVWSGYAVGVPPLAYQWRRNGVPIPGATASALGITNVGLANIGTYDLRVTNAYGAVNSSPVTIGDQVVATRISNLVPDSNPEVRQHNGLNHGAAWVASSNDGSVTRSGVMSFNANTSSQITVSGETNFNSSTGTIMFWMRSSGLANPGGSSAALFDRYNNTNGCLLSQYGDGRIEFDANGNETLVGTVTTSSMISDNHWHHIAVVYDESPTGPLSGALNIYVDGHLDTSSSVGANWSWPAGQELEFGLSHDTNSWQAYNGLLDDVRFYNRGFTSAEITSAYGGALVDTNALVMQLNFTAAPQAGITLTWQAPDGMLQSADSVKGPYTDVPGGVSQHSVSVQQTEKFYRYRHRPVLVVSNPYLM